MSTEKRYRFESYKNRIFIILIIVFSFISCVKNYKSGDCLLNYTIFIGNNISIDKEEAEAELFQLLREGRNSTGRISAEIVIFSFSSGKELFSYSGENQENIVTNTQTGKIEALVKIKQDNKLEKVLFINAEGSSRKEILHRLAIAIREALCGF